MNTSEMWITNSQLKLLKKLKRRSMIIPDNDRAILDVTILSLYKLIRLTDGKYEITLQGMLCLDYHLRRRLWHWLPVIISNIMSLIALVLSLITMFLR